MPFNKMGGGSGLAGPGYPISLAPGQAFMLPAGQGTVGSFGAVTYPQVGSGNVFTGQYIIGLGLYSQLLFFTRFQANDRRLRRIRRIVVEPFLIATGRDFQT